MMCLSTKAATGNRGGMNEPMVGDLRQAGRHPLGPITEPKQKALPLLLTGSYLIARRHTQPHAQVNGVWYDRSPTRSYCLLVVARQAARR